MNIGDRFKYFRESLQINKAEMARRLTASPSLISDIEIGRKEPSKNLIISMMAIFGCNANWLLTGEGEMFLDTVEAPKGIKVLIEPQKGAIPYYDVDVMAHIAEALDVRENPAAYVSAPGFEDCFACFPVYGNSMAPKISSGDIVCVSKILAVEHILWGEIYVIVTDVMRVVKTLHPGKTDECLVLRSINPDFAGDTVLKKEDIKALYLVKGIISRIAM